MILVFIILGIIILISLTMFLFILSNLKLEIKKLHISNNNVDKKLKADFVLNIGVYWFNRIKVINFTIDNYKISNLLKAGKIDLKKLKNNKAANKDILKALKDNEFEIEYLKLEGYFATFNPVLSSIIFAFINAIIPIAIATKINGKYINRIELLNINENVINLSLNCIISLKIVNIINILHYLKKKGGKNNGKSSDRRSYAYSNE